jgi:hypothetical protein
VFSCLFATTMVKPLLNQGVTSELDLEQVIQVNITIPRPWQVRAS